MNNSIILTVNELSKVTNGKWIGDTSSLEINAITNGILHNNILNAMWITRNPENWGKEVPNTVINIKNMIQKAASCILIEERFQDQIQLYNDIPFLVVKDTRKALYHIANASSKKSEYLKKVQITGTEGKTSFKYALSFLTSKQINTFSQESSANMQVPILISLSNIKKSTQLSIIEISCPAKDLGKNRSNIVHPDIAVITNVNPSHLNSHGSLDNLISNKAESVIGIKENGYCIVNADTENFDTLIKKIKSFRNDINIVTYGINNFSNAKVIQAKFHNLGWDIEANINGKHLIYRVNRVQEHIPTTSVGVLLCVDLLGLDINKASKDLMRLDKWFESSGSIYKKQINNGSFLFYDQHFSVTEIAMKSALNDLNRIKVYGKKIVVISGEYNSDIYTEEIHKRIGEYLNNTEIDYLYTVGEHINISINTLKNKFIHKQHFDNIESCSATICKEIKENDLLFIKGMTKLNFKYLSDFIHKKYNNII